MTLLQTRPPEVEINLLPSEIRTEQAGKRKFNIATAAAIALLVILGLLTVNVRMQIASAERTLHASQAQATQLRGQVASLHEFEELKASIDGNRAILATALVGDVSWTRFLDNLDTYLPGDSWLSNVTVSAQPSSTPQGEAALGTVQFSAKVTSMRGLAHWLDTMSAIKGLRFVYLSNGSKSKGEDGQEVVDFTASAFINDAMLSGRCQTEDSQCP
jgi:Tfp pilus assembly protein PilN